MIRLLKSPKMFRSFKNLYFKYRNGGFMSKMKPCVFNKRDIEPSDLYFGQQHPGTVDFFEKPWHTVHIKDFPHYKFLTGDHDYYKKYLINSWTYHSIEGTEENYRKQLEKFSNLFLKIKNEGVKKPITYFVRPDGKKIIVDGNHRASIACFLNQTLPAVKISMQKYIYKSITMSDAFYRRGNDHIPPTSLFYQGNELIVGRRRDIIRHFDLIDKEDIVGKRVLDLNCGIGASSFAAAEKGAEYVLGIEKDTKTVTGAIRTNVAFTYPCEFVSPTFSKNAGFKNKFDTCFCFTTDDYHDANIQLANILTYKISSVLYIETKNESDIPKVLLNHAKGGVYFKGKIGSKTCLYKIVLGS